jgi:3',5'-cyclic AMP phosphodiesterase CpdA
MNINGTTKEEGDAFEFVYAADMQPGSPESFRYRGAWFDNWRTAREQIIAAKPAFMVIGGDLTRDGFYNDFEFEDMKKSIDSMNIPYHAIPGNMDVGNKVTIGKTSQTEQII